MSKYKVIPPFICDMGSISPYFIQAYPMETRNAAALWEINSMRRHDGLIELDRLPPGFKFELINH